MGRDLLQRCATRGSIRKLHRRFNKLEKLVILIISPSRLRPKRTLFSISETSQCQIRKSSGKQRSPLTGTSSQNPLSVRSSSSVKSTSRRNPDVSRPNNCLGPALSLRFDRLFL